MSNKPQDAESKQPDSSFIQLDDTKQKGAASVAPASRRKALVGVLTAVCIALIVVSLGFVYPSVSGAWSIDWIVETVTGRASLPRMRRFPARLPLRVRLRPRTPNLRTMRRTGRRTRMNLIPRTLPNPRTRTQKGFEGEEVRRQGREEVQQRVCRTWLRIRRWIEFF